jgi:hypothetical protein
MRLFGRRDLIAVALAALAIVPLAAADEHAASTVAKGPPVNEAGYFVDRGACPFECCGYGRWSVRQDTALRAGPGADGSVGVANKGTFVESVTGTVYTRPIPVDVIHDHTGAYPRTAFKSGDRLYLLTYLGEGFNRAWFEGQFLEIEVDIMADQNMDRFRVCAAPSTNCWWSVDPAYRLRDHVWWVRLRLPDGTEGWTDQAENFGDVDGCG